MLKIKKYFLIPLFLLVFTLGIFNICFALEVRLPGLPANPSPGDYTVFIIKFATGLAGAIAVLAFIIGAIGYMASAGNPNAAAEGISRMKSAILGVILLFSSYLILQTIGGQKLTTLTIDKPEHIAMMGLYLTDGKTEIPCPGAVENTAELPKGFTTIKARCEDKDADFLLSTYGETGLKGKATNQEFKCGGQGSIKKSYKIIVMSSGVYVYDENDNYTILTSSAPNLGSSIAKYGDTEAYDYGLKPGKSGYYFFFLGEPKSPEADTYFGKCEYPLTMRKGGLNPYKSPSIVVFDFSKYPEYAGDGVVFFSNPHYNTKHAGGMFEVKKNDPKIGGANFSADKIVFTYPPGVPEEEKKACAGADGKPNFAKCPGSIRIAGDYLVILIAKKGNDYYCEVFNPFSNTTNIIANRITQEGRILDSVKIVPVDAF